MAPAQLSYYVVGACIAAAAVLFIVLVVLSIKGPPKLPVPASEGAPRKGSVFRFVTAMLVTGTVIGAAIALSPWWPNARAAITQLVDKL